MLLILLHCKVPAHRWNELSIREMYNVETRKALFLYSCCIFCMFIILLLVLFPQMVTVHTMILKLLNTWARNKQMMKTWHVLCGQPSELIPPPTSQMAICYQLRTSVAILNLLTLRHGAIHHWNLQENGDTVLWSNVVCFRHLTSLLATYINIIVHICEVIYL